MTGQTVERKNEDSLQQAAHILNKLAKNCKHFDTNTSTTMNVSEEAAFHMIPKVLIMFVTTMVTGGKYKKNEGIKNISQEIKSKILNIIVNKYSMELVKYQLLLPLEQHSIYAMRLAVKV